MENTKCEGSCEEHKGDVKKVKVYEDDYSGRTWFFDYCQEAIEEDKRRGFTVEILPDELELPEPPEPNPLIKT
jgi:hypothetical protein